MRRTFLLFLCLMIGASLCACSNNQEIIERLTVSHTTAARIEKNGDEKGIDITSEIASLHTFDNLSLDAPDKEVPLLGEWVYRITFNPPDLVKNSSAIIVQFGENCLSINDRIYIAGEGVSYEDILEWVESKYALFS